MKFEEMLKFGEEGEKEIASILIKKGHSVIPLYQFNSDHAPFLLNTDLHITLPDLTCFNGDVVYFVECKRKNQWVKWNFNQETGFDYRNYNHYREIKRLTNSRLYIFFKHEHEDPGVYYCEIDKYQEHELRLWGGLRKGTQERIGPAIIYWRKNQLKKVNN